MKKRPYSFYNPIIPYDYYGIKSAYWCDSRKAYEGLADTAPTSEERSKYRALEREAQKQFEKYYHIKSIHEALQNGIKLDLGGH